MGFDYASLAGQRKFEMPNDWRITTIGDVATINELVIQRDYPHESIEYIDIACVERGVVNSIQELPLSDAPSRAKRIVRDNDTLISTVRPNLEHYTYVKRAKPHTIASTGFAVVTAKSVDPRYLYYYLTTKPFTAYLSQIADSHTSAYPAINPDVIETAELLLPPPGEQRAIAAILGILDDKIELNRQMNKTLEEMAQALFKSWFVDFEPFRGQGMQDSPLGEIPVGWRVGKLDDIASVTSGKRPGKRNSIPDKEKTIPLYGGGGPMGYVENPLYTKPLILTGRVGTLGMVFRISFPCWPSDNTLVVLHNEDTSYEYLYFQMCLTDFDSLNRGSTQPLVTQTDLQRHEIIVPANAAITKFNSIVSPIFHSIDHNINESGTLSAIRDTILSKLLSGEIRVKDAEKFMEKAI